MTEVELKFLADEAGLGRLKRRLKAEGLVDAMPRPRALRSVYFDTPDHDLRQAGIALRLRREGRRWLQTAKAKAVRTGALQQAAEAECPAPGGRLQVRRIPDAEIRGRVEAVLNGHDPAPVAETQIRRAVIELPLDGGGRAELALDQGEVVAGDRREPLCEIEIELKDGSLDALLALAHRLFPEGGLDVSRLSKAERGYRLAAGQAAVTPPEPRKAGAVELSRRQSAETAARDVLRECVEQIVANAEAVRASDDPEGPHQLRVGLRRLRSAFSVFKPAIDAPERARLSDEARWLGQVVGRLRDLDVAAEEILAPASARRPDEPGFAALLEAVEKARGRARAEVRKTVESARAQALFFDLARFVEARGWLRPDDFDQTGRLAAPVSDLAASALRKRWKSAARLGRDIEALDIEARHDLRKELKKLRYAVEFFAPIYPDKQLARFLKSLKRLQEVFGDLNDAAMVQELLTGPDAPGANDAHAQRAVGLVLGRADALAETAWADARALWDDLRAVKAFWR